MPWPYDEQAAKGEMTDEQFVTAAQHMAEAEHLREVARGVSAHGLRDRNEKMDESLAKTDPEEPPIPFLLTLYFRHGLIKTFSVTMFNYDEEEQEYVWEQAAALPGDELLRHVAFSDVVMVTVASIEPGMSR